MAKKKLNFLLIEHGGPRKEFVFKMLKHKGLEVFLACTRIPKWVTNYIPQENILVTDTYNSVKLLSEVTAFFESRGEKLRALGTFYEHTVTQTADLATALNLTGLDPGAARRSSSNKLLMRISCRDGGIPTPNFVVVSNPDVRKLKGAILEVGIPCVVKPVFGAESYGIVKIEDARGLKDVIREIEANTTSDKKETFKNFTGVFLVEEYLPGVVVSVDGLVQNKKVMIAGLVEFVMGPEPRFTQEANFIPSRLDRKTVSTCYVAAKRIINILGFDNCGFHCEFRVTPEALCYWKSRKVAGRAFATRLQESLWCGFDVSTYRCLAW